MSIRPGIKHGLGRLTAAAEGGVTGSGITPMTPRTRLTQVSHKAPMRFVPMLKSSIEEAGAAVCALSNYGGGMLQGDTVELHVHAKSGCRLGVTTQGASRIYTQRVPNACKATLNATVDPQALLVWAPDPCSLFLSSSFKQDQQFTIDRTSSVALIDWFSSGRYRNGEQWSFDLLSTRTSLTFANEEAPFLQDAMHLDLSAQATSRAPFDPLGVMNFQAFASLILYGDQVQAVQEQCQNLADALLAQHTRIRARSESDTTSEVNLDELGLSGRVCMGVSRIKLPSAGDQLTDEREPHQVYAHVVRLAATTNEDLYRIFHHCLLPLHKPFGLEFYKERIRAKASEIPTLNGSTTTPTTRPPSSKELVVESEEVLSDSDDASMWSAFMLADSSLPTGGFAHSAGLEAAAQLGLIQSQDQMETFINAATRSSVQITVPFLEAGHAFATSQLDKEMDGEDTVGHLVAEWKRLDSQAQAVFASNAPACAASLDQGKSLARVAQQWLDAENVHDQRLLQCFSQGYHVGLVMGALASRLGLTKAQLGRLFGYCVARDMVSAAVRLSLVGPLASIKSLQKAQGAGHDGWKIYLRQQAELGEQVIVKDPMVAAAASAPIVEALHPCHEALQVRLFRT